MCLAQPGRFSLSAGVLAMDQRSRLMVHEVHPVNQGGTVIVLNTQIHGSCMKICSAVVFVVVPVKAYKVPPGVVRIRIR